MSRRIEVADGRVHELISIGKGRGYLLCEEVNDMLPAEVRSPEEIDDLLAMFEHCGIEIYEDNDAATAARVSAKVAEHAAAEAKEEIAHDDTELDLSVGTEAKTEDPVRLYLREMGSVPLLTREGEVAIAKRIERGQPSE